MKFIKGKMSSSYIGNGEDWLDHGRVCKDRFPSTWAVYTI